MSFVTLITAEELSRHARDESFAIVDCRFSLDDTNSGQRDYLAAHIPGAVYAHLDHDLSGERIPDKTGRHPLPDRDDLTHRFSGWGIDRDTQVVAYDAAGGAMAAARLWWLLKWLGHPNVSVLDGGLAAWRRLDLPLVNGEERRALKRFEAHELRGAYVNADQVGRYAHDPGWALLDARSALRFRGESEPVDPVAGHIPGALSAPCDENLTADGLFLPPEALRQRFERLTKGVSPENVICYCGSGVTAAHNLLAMAYAGMGMARLYAGSWSEWIADPTRPVATKTE